jgi:hypothetical protein
MPAAAKNTKVHFMKNCDQTADFHCVTALTPTVCDLCGVRRPAQCDEEPIAAVMTAAEEVLGDERLEKILLFAPDAVGMHLWERFPEKLAALTALAPLRVATRAVMPSVTPVCFASMFSGALPEVHGIQEYAKPVLSCETLFNTFPEAGWRSAIAAVQECSIDKIFRKRPLTYISTMDDAETLAFSEMLLRQRPLDFLLSYAVNYDKQLHATGPFSETALAAFEQNLRSFETLCALVDEVWAAHNRAVIFCPDHGGHATDASGTRGAHGKDIPEDMHVCHFYRIKAKKQP